MKAGKPSFNVAANCAIALVAVFLLHMTQNAKSLTGTQHVQVNAQPSIDEDKDKFIGSDGKRGRPSDAPDDAFGCRILGQSGKFRCSSSQKGRDEGSAGTKWFSIELAALTERDADGTAVGTKFEQFASADFTFSDFTSTKLGDSDATMITFTANLNQDQGTVTMTTYMVESEGTFTVGNDTVSVVKHDIKWSTKLEGWSFSTAGEYLDIDMQIMGPKGGQAVGENEFNFGVEIDTAGSVEVDGQEVELPSGYPELITNGNKEILRVRVPKFETSASYDPVARSSTMDEESAGYSTFTANTGATMIAAIGSAIIALVTV